GPTNGDGHRGASDRALVTAPARPLPVPPARRRAAPRRRWLAAVLVLVLLTGLAVAGRVVAERPGTSTASTAAATTAASGSPTAGRPAPVVATVGTGGFSHAMVAGAAPVWVLTSGEGTRIDPATNSVTARIPVAATGSGPAAVAVEAGAVWVPGAGPPPLRGLLP